jgi:hypothetical protein
MVTCSDDARLTKIIPNHNCMHYLINISVVIKIEMQKYNGVGTAQK